MKQNLNLKISGEKEEIQKLIELLETSYEVKTTSRYIENIGESGYHIFLYLLEVKA